MSKVEINCPRCNPEGKPHIRRLNRTDTCLICWNWGWTTFDKICKCGKPSGIWITCDSCVATTTGFVSDMMDSLAFAMATLPYPTK